MSAVDRTAVREWLFRTQHQRLKATLAAGRAVAAPCARTDDFVADLRAVLASRSLLAAYANLLTELRAACDGEQEAPPIVPKPPYVTVTSLGPVLRLTRPTDRIVIRLAIREITDDGTYEFRHLDTVQDLPEITIRTTPG